MQEERGDEANPPRTQSVFKMSRQCCSMKGKGLTIFHKMKEYYGRKGEESRKREGGVKEK